jgi:tRNA A-37 threonylcarbamoyl transferase component Bud32/tetratricopeptide (TPR) repeat protein
LPADVSPPGPIAPTGSPVEAALTRGTALGRFVVLGLVGRGAMGEVYGAYDPELDRKVAIKLVRARGGRGNTADSRARLMREAQATAKVSHPNVIVVYDAGTFEDRVFVAMEFIEGHTLRYWLEARDRTWPEIVEIFVAAGRGLAAAHEKELVHRDFKPDNVMVRSDGQVRVMDFGLARTVSAAEGDARPAPANGPRAPVARQDVAERDEDLESTRELGATQLGATQLGATRDARAPGHLTETGTVAGTPAYMSPEQFERRPTDARSDQFSFCVALWEAVHGARPFAGRSLDELTENVVAGRLVEPPAASKVPAWVRRVLERGLATDPAARWPSMPALLAELDAKPALAHGADFAAGAAARLAGTWEAPVAGNAVSTPAKAEMHRAFLATGKAYAADAFTGASAVLDRFARRWTEIYIDACEATHVRGEQSAEVLDLRMAALAEGLADLKALCRLFAEATPAVVENAVSAATALGTLERCQDVNLLRAAVRPPADAATRAAVEALRARLVDVRALLRVGRVAEGLEASGPLLEEARRLAYGPLLAEVLLVHGTLLNEAARIDQAAAVLEEAVWAAELARHEEAAAEAATHMVYLAGYAAMKFELAELWGRHAETLLRRMGGHDLLWGWYLNNRSATREQQGRLVEAIEDMRLAIAAKERALGPLAPDVGGSIGNLSNQLASRGDFAAAFEASQRAVDIVGAGFGPDHPRTAIYLSNHGELLCRVGRYAEAGEVAARALVVLERETDPQGPWVTYPLLTLGLSLLGTGRAAEARPVLERATRIRDSVEKTPARLAEIHFALARALHDAPTSTADRAAALTLARQARDEYTQSVVTPSVTEDKAALEAWLTKNA